MFPVELGLERICCFTGDSKLEEGGLGVEEEIEEVEGTVVEL